MISPDRPGMPGIPDIEEVGGDFVSLTWQKPSSDGGGRIKGYIIEKKDANYDSWTRVNQVPSPSTIFNVANLIEDREYEFRVIAVNDAGESQAATTVRKVKVKDPKGELCCHLVSKDCDGLCPIDIDSLCEGRQVASIHICNSLCM